MQSPTQTQSLRRRLELLAAALRVTAWTGTYLLLLLGTQTTLQACAGYGYWYSTSKCTSPADGCAFVPGVECPTTTMQTGFTGKRCSPHPINDDRCVCD